MMGLIRSLTGWVRVKYISADIGAVLGELERRQVIIFDVCAVDELTIEFSVEKQYLNMLWATAERRGEKVEICGKMGLFWPLRTVLRRPLLSIGIWFLAAVAAFLPGRILFVQVEGNELIPTNRILEAAADSGLGFGAGRRSIRSEQIKNKLLDGIPELGWAGVNTYGSRAVITVRERDHEVQRQSTYPVRHIVASRDGIVTSCTVTDGCGVCSVGQAVKKGDILISGYTDCGITIRATAAEGRVLASTRHNLTVLTPAKCCIRTVESDQTVRYSVILGKKQINFYKGSGISGAGCVKMYTEYVLRLPGGFVLPVRLRRECLSDSAFVLADATDTDVILESFAADYLIDQMLLGTVNEKRESFTDAEEFRILEGEYACTEDIGIIQDEKIGDFHGKADGTDRERGSGG